MNKLDYERHAMVFLFHCPFILNMELFINFETDNNNFKIIIHNSYILQQITCNEKQKKSVDTSDAISTTSTCEGELLSAIYKLKMVGNM